MFSYKALFISICLSLSYVSPAPASGLAHKVLDSAINYSEGEFEFQQEGPSIYTTPFRPHIAPTQSVQIYRDTPQEAPYEKVLNRTVNAQDGRQRIYDTTKWPNLFHSQLTMLFSKGEYGGSGILVGPQHLLTAAHNIYDFDRKEWSTKIMARVALNDQVAPFDNLKVTKVFTFDKWVKDKDSKFDMALLVLEQPIGLKTGWCGLLSSEDRDLLENRVTITGYPGDKGLNQMWSMTHTIKRVDSEQMFYEIDTYGGQSGSGIWINKWGSPYVIGIHTLGESALYTGNSGVRLSAVKIKSILDWIKQTRDLKQEMPSLLKAVNTLSILSESAETQYKRGLAYYSGCGVVQSYAEAAKWYRKAADQGNAEAQYNLGCMYENGEDIEQDFAEAAKWYRKAADQGNVDAQCDLGNMYAEGTGVKEDDKEAMKWYRKAAEQGDAHGEFSVGWMYAKGRGIFKDFAEAAKWYRKAADQEHDEAQYKLGKLYEKGRGVSKNNVEATKWYQKAADQGNVDAENKLNPSVKYSKSNSLSTNQSKNYIKTTKTVGKSTYTRPQLSKKSKKVTINQAVKYIENWINQGKSKASLATKLGVSTSTITRFLEGTIQDSPTIRSALEDLLSQGK